MSAHTDVTHTRLLFVVIVVATVQLAQAKISEEPFGDLRIIAQVTDVDRQLRHGFSENKANGKFIFYRRLLVSFRLASACCSCVIGRRVGRGHC
jgi:hypothetical protein